MIVSARDRVPPIRNVPDFEEAFGLLIHVAELPIGDQQPLNPDGGRLSVDEELQSAVSNSLDYLREWHPRERRLNDDEQIAAVALSLGCPSLKKTTSGFTSPPDPSRESRRVDCRADLRQRVQYVVK
jgi:hypothetical protein